MKKISKSLILFAIPLLLFFVTAEWLLRKIPNAYSFKAAAYKKNASKMETWILGNSYALYDLNPVYFSAPAYNGAHLIQTLDLDAAIFRKYEPMLPNLKNVIIPISDMSFFFKLGNSPEAWRVANYSIYYGLRPSYRFADYLQILSLPFPVNRNRLLSYYLQRKSDIAVSELGFGNNYNSGAKHDLNNTALETGRIHRISDFKEFKEEQESLEKIIAACEKRQINVLLFIPPAYSGYVSTIDSLQLRTTINTCGNFVSSHPNVRFFNFLTDTSFHEQDYFDAVHLNEIGAKKMSLKINSLLSP